MNDLNLEYSDSMRYLNTYGRLDVDDYNPYPPLRDVSNRLECNRYNV